MRKIFLFFSLIGLVSVNFSCNRETTCECVSHYQGADTSWVSKEKIILFRKKKIEAQEICNGMNKSSTILTETLNVECKIIQ